MRYQVPKWFKSLPVGSHGFTREQKKAWKVVSDYVRKRDWKKYKRCVSCGTYLESWQKGQAGHFISWGSSNGMFKYHLKNIALQCGYCNTISDGKIGHAFGEELKRRYGDGILEELEKENQKHRGKKIEVWELVEMCEKLLNDKTF